MFGEGFSVGVDLLLASNAERVLGVLGSELTGVEGKAGRLKTELGTLKSAFAGAFAIGAAKELLGVMDEMIKKGADLEQQLYKIATAGYTKSDVDAFRKNAAKVAGQFRNVNEKELLKLTLETSAVYGDPQTAMKFLPISAAYIAAEKYRHPENPEGAAAIAEDAIFKVLRSEEFRGLAQDPREVKRGLAASLKGQEVFGDQFDPAISFQFMKYLRLSGRYVSDRFLNGPGLIVAQEMGGSNAGNSHNMVMQALVGGHAAKSAVEEMMKVGMIDRNKVDKVGGKNWHYDISRAVPDVKLLQSDFDLWAQKHIRIPVDAFTKGDLSKRDQELRKIFGRATQQQYAELMAWQTGPGGRFAKDVTLLGKALTPEDAVAAASDNLATAGQNLATQVDRIATNVGAVGARLEGHVAKVVLPAVSGLADKTGTDDRLNAAILGGMAAGIAGGVGFGAYKLLPMGSRMWRALNPASRSLSDDEGGPGQPGGEGPAGPRGGGSPRPPRAPKPLPRKLRLSAADDVAGTEHVDFRGTAAAGAGKALGVAAEEAVGKAGAGLVSKVVGRIVLAPVSELMMGWDTAKEMKRNQETYGAGAWAWLTHNRAMGERAYARLQGADLSIAHRGGLRTSPDLRGPVAAAGIPEDAKLRAAYGTTIKAVNDLGTATSALARDQIVAGKATRDFTSALIAMAQRAQSVQVHTDINIDGRKVANAVTTHQVHQMTGPRATARPDMRAALPSPAAGYSY